MDSALARTHDGRGFHQLAVRMFFLFVSIRDAKVERRRVLR
jgi:hypothetical protein